MISAKCPHCGNIVQVKETFLGKKIRCKNVECNHVYEIKVEELQPVQVHLIEPPAKYNSNHVNRDEDFNADNDDEWDESDLELPARKAVKKKKKKSEVAQEDRYPNLSKYLSFGRISAKFTLGVFAFIALLTLFVSFSSFLNSFSENDIARHLYIQSFIIFFLAGIGIAIVGYLQYVFLMAGIEFVQVVIDIEENTRNRE